MARDEAPPFGRGEYQDATAGSASGVGALDHLIGKEWVFEDIDYSTGTVGARPSRTNRKVRCRLIKNSAGFALLPKRLAAFKTSNGPDYGAVVDGYTATDYSRGYPVDEWLPSAGVPDGNYFWLVVDGPSQVLTSLSGAGFNGDISVGNVLVALTAVTSGATTAGRVANQNITGSSQATDYTFILNQAENNIGRALSAKTTGNTNASLLVEVGHW